MPLQLQEGKFYRDESGEKVGPMVFMVHSYLGPNFWGRTPDGSRRDYYIDGSSPYFAQIVAEWTDGPVRTVTRREVVPGNYGIVMVYRVGDSIRTEFNRSDAGPSELRAAAAVLLELAEALEDD